VSVLEAAMDYKLKPLELWAFVTSSIKGADWTCFFQADHVYAKGVQGASGFLVH
jgi:hypothetical protein